MKRLLYKTLFILLFFNGSVFAQKKILYNDQIDVKKATEISLDIKNIPLKIIESLDNTIYIDFSMKFKNHSEKEINSYKKKLKIVKKVIGKTINLTIQSKNKISPVNFELSDGFYLTIPNTEIKDLNNEIGERKTKKQIVSQIFTKELKDQSFAVTLLNAIKKDKKAQIREAYFTLRIPKHLKFKIEAKETSLIFEGMSINDANVTMTKGNFQGEKIVNSKFNLKDTELKVVEFIGGNVKLLNVLKSLIGSVQKTHLEIESSKIEIGEVGESVSVQDFSSELFFYNFSSDFKDFKLTGEYSKIHFYEPIEDYSMTVVGNDTTFYHDGNTIVSQPSKENKKFKMMVRKPKKDKHFSGKIKFDITHSIFYYSTYTNN